MYPIMSDVSGDEELHRPHLTISFEPFSLGSLFLADGVWGGVVILR